MTREEFESKCYDAYCLDWMLSHGYSLDDYRNGIFDGILEHISNNEEISDLETLDEAFVSAMDTFENSQGFGSGSIYVGYDEFLGAEFKDDAYMQHLLSLMPNSKEMEDFWRTEYKRFSYVPKISVATSAGVINAYESCDPGQPGIAVCLVPAGYEEEIDLSYVSVYEDPEYATEDHEQPVDVSIMTYADPADENYTRKDIIRREWVVDALGIGGKA